jgi:hypothetical protein
VSHPLIELANDSEVRQAAGFQKAAAGITGASLAESYATERGNAPRLHEAGRRYFVARGGKPPAERKRNKDEEHAGAALVGYCRERSEGLALPADEGSLHLLDYQVRLKAGPLNEPATRGIGRADLIGVTDAGRLAVVKFRYAEPTATRCGVGDTPLRGLLEGLTYCAIVSANAAEIGSEVTERFGRTPIDEPPLLVMLASPRYWELCRKRAAQKGAAWIKELERLAAESEQDVGVTVRYLGLALEGDPGWSYAEDGVVLDGAPKLVTAWEAGAGRVKPKAKPRPKTSRDPIDEIIEPDFSRPVRGYALTESYDAGDRIDHPKLGMGVVQGVAGPGKIRVRFDEKQSVLVHERPAPGA